MCVVLILDVNAICAHSRGPADILAIEQTDAFEVYTSSLMGHLSPIDGIGPEKLGIDQLRLRLQTGEITEVIMAHQYYG